MLPGSSVALLLSKISEGDLALEDRLGGTDSEREVAQCKCRRFLLLVTGTCIRTADFHGSSLGPTGHNL